VAPILIVANKQVKGLFHFPVVTQNINFLYVIFCTTSHLLLIFDLNIQSICLSSAQVSMTLKIMYLSSSYAVRHKVLCLYYRAYISIAETD
jgi:hypothetical protein